jgi:PelA/Pel-15E family pectate lyase
MTDGEGSSRLDAELLAAYSRGGSSSTTAFETLVKRHGSMVYRACVRILEDREAAEDAAQTTFAVLARRAGTVRGSLGAWLHRVALNAARQVRRSEQARRVREKEAARMVAVAMQDAETSDSWGQISPHLDAELERLPSGQRAALVLHYLEGKSQSETARILGVSAGTVRAQVSRGLKRLRGRLARRGVVLSAGALAAMMAAEAAEPACPALLLASAKTLTIAASAGLPAGIAALMKGVIRTMVWEKVKLASAGVIVAALVAGTGIAVTASGGDKTGKWRPVSIAAFRDSIHHATMKYKNGKPPYRQYSPRQIVHIAENLLAGQNPDGGWPPNKDWIRAFPPGKRSSLRGGRSTLDNRSTWSQIDYLARVHRQTGVERYAQSALKGIEYVLRRQGSSGGWRGRDVAAITFNDDVMAGVLRTLKAARDDRQLYSFVQPAVRDRVKAAYRKGLKCVLACQIKVGDRLTAWGQQHSHKTLRPVWARSFEPPSIVSAESVRVVRFLMSIENPPPEVVASIQAAVAWLDRVKIEGIRVKEVKAKPVKFKHHWSDSDRVVVKDPQAPPIWARFYDLKTEEPIFCTRQRKITSDYADVCRERRTGYSWYGYYPARLLKAEYPRWQKKWAPGKNVLKHARK